MGIAAFGGGRPTGSGIAPALPSARKLSDLRIAERSSDSSWNCSINRGEGNGLTCFYEVSKFSRIFLATAGSNHASAQHT